MDVFTALKNSKFVGIKEALVIRILTEYNCRVSEVLRARWVNFYEDRFLVLEGLKRSRNVIVRDKDILSEISNFPRNLSEYIFYPVKYRRIYELCIRVLNQNITTYTKKKNNKVTHYFRYKNVSALDNDKIIQDVLHHNSARSSGYYKTIKKGSTNDKKN